MKYTLNKLKTKTTNNFKVNDIVLDLDIPKLNDFKDYDIENTKDIIIKSTIKKEPITSSIGLTLNKYKDLDIVIPKNTNIKDNIIIRYNFINNDNLVDNINITYEENTNANIIIIYKSIDDKEHFHFLKENLINKSSSTGSITLINLLNDNSINFYSIENSMYENSNITHNIIDLGGKIRLSNMISNLNYINSTNKLNNIYLGINNDIIDTNYYLVNNNKNTKNIIRAEGYLKDNSKKTFRGIIDFVKGCSASLGDEKENVVIDSDTVLSRSLPELLCHEEDVEGTHGVSTGRVSPNKLFYLMTKGFSMEDAKRLIILANFSSIISKINDSKIEEEVEEFIENKIN